MPIGLGGTRDGHQDPFYNYRQFQKDPNHDWTKSPVIGGAAGYLEQNQDATYNRFLARMGAGLGNTSPYSQWLRSQFDTTQLGFKSALAEDPTLTYQRYLSGLNMPQIRNIWRGMSPYQRGQNVSRYTGPVRTISDI